MTEHSVQDVTAARGWMRVRKFVSGGAAAALVAGTLVFAGIGVQSAVADEPAPVASISPSNSPVLGEDVTFSVGVDNPSGSNATYNLSATLLFPNGASIVSSGSLGVPTIYASGVVLPGTMAGPADSCVALGLVEPTPPQTGKCAVPPGMQFATYLNFSDLPATASMGTSIVLRPKVNLTDSGVLAEGYAVGDTLDVVFNAYTSAQERYIPMFPGSTGVGGAAAIEATSPSDPMERSTKIKALRIEKSEPSDEQELLRGVHSGRTTIYTLAVHHTGEGDLTDSTIVDYLPAGLEYLGSCDLADSTTDAGNGFGADEWNGSGSMATGGVGADCLNETAVETVKASAQEASDYGLVAGQVYTKVTWDVGTLQGSAGTTQSLPNGPGTPGVTTIKYRAGVPLFENSLFDATQETALGERGQGANLDNNRGPSTRHGSPNAADGDSDKAATAWTNVAIGGGNWRGVTGNLEEVWSEDHNAEQIDAVDVRVLKSVRVGNDAWAKSASFEQGNIADYRLEVSTSEYVGASVADLPTRVSDTMANGLCPVYPANTPLSPAVSQQGHPNFTLSPGSNSATLTQWNAALVGAGLSECQWNTANTDTAANFSGATLTSVAFDQSTGRFAQDVLLDPVNATGLAKPNATIDVIYSARQNQSYVTSNGENGATSSGDTVRNSIEVEAKTTPQEKVAGIKNAGGAEVGGDYFAWDDSHASVSTSFGDMQKRVLRNDPAFGSLDASEVVALDHGTGAITSPTDPGYPWTLKEEKPFGIGDQVWFKIHWDTSAGAEVRNPVLTDFLPEGVTFDPSALDDTNQWGASPNLRVVATRNGQPITIDANNKLEITPLCSYTDPAVAFSEFVGKVAPSDGNSRLTWKLGSDSCYSSGPSQSTARFWPGGIDLDFYIQVTVTDAQAFGKVDLSQNLAKYQQQNVDGQIYFLRRQAEIVPDMSPRLVKGIASVGAEEYGVNSNVDAEDRGTVVQTDALSFRLDVTSPAAVTSGYEVWDALPEGILAEDIEGYNSTTHAIDATAKLWSDSVTGPSLASGFTAHVYNWNDADFPYWDQVHTAYKDRSIVVWTITEEIEGSTPAIGEAPMVQRGISLFYTINVPDGTSGRAALIAQQYTNTASIAQFDVKNNQGLNSTVISNVPTVPAGTETPTGGSSKGVGSHKDGQTSIPVSKRAATDVVGSIPISAEFMTDPSGFELPDAKIEKRLLSTEIGPDSAPTVPFGEQQLDPANGSGQIVQGEFATFDYTVTIPAHTSVPAGAVLADRGYLTLGTRTGTRVNYAVDASGTSVTLPTNATAANFNFAAATGTLTFVERYDAGDEDRTFTVKLRVRVANASASALLQGNTLVNVATFTYDNGQGEPKVLDDDATVQYVDPVPTLGKTVSGTQGANGEVTFTLTAGNTTGRPALYDAVVYDCLPAGFTLPAQTFAPTAGTVDPVNPVINCSVTGTGANVRVTHPDPAGTGTLIKWNVGKIDAGSPQTLSFKATIDPDAAGGETYTNSAQIIGHTLPSTLTDSDTRRGDRTTGAQRSVPIAPATLAKSVSPAQAPVGATVTYTLTTQIPANANYYFVDLKDQLPAGVRYVAGSAAVVEASGLPIVAEPTVTQHATNADQLNWAVTGGTIATAPSPRTIVITYQAKILSQVTDAAPKNTAVFSWNTSATSNNPDTRIGTTEQTATVTILNPNLTVEKRVKLAGGLDTTYGAAKTGNPDQGFTYRVQVTNNGKTPAYHATITDCLPAGVVSITSVSNGGSYSSTSTTGCTGGTITWTNLGPIPVNGTLDLTYNAKFAPSADLSVVAPATNGTGVKLNNTAKVVEYASYGTDGWIYRPGATGTPGKRPGGSTIPTTGTSSVAGVTPLFPYVTLAKSAADTTKTAYVGEPFEWVLTATNGGKGAAQKVVLTDTLPANWEFTAVTSIKVNGAAQPLTVPTGAPEGPLVWTFGSDATDGSPAAILGSDQSIVIRYTATPKNPDALTTPGVGGSNPHVNTLAAVTTDRGNATRNKTTTHTGPNASDSAFLRVADLKLVKSAIGGTTGTAPAGHPLAGVPADQWMIGQVIEPGVYAQPQWEIVVTNHGPDDSYGPFKIDEDAAAVQGITLGSWTAVHVSATGVETVLGNYSGTSFDVGTSTTKLLSNGSDKIVLRANVTIDATAIPGSTAENTASVLGRTYEAPGTQGPAPNPNPNTNDAERPLVESADLQVTKAVSATPNAGGAISWTITPRNNGPSVSRNTAANPITITDVIPVGVNGVADPSTPMWAATTPGGFPANTGATITFSLDSSYASLSLGAHTAILMSGTVDPAWTPTSGPQSDGSIINTAVIAPGTGLTPDPKTPNNTSSVPTTPTFNTTLAISKDRVVKQGDEWVLAASLTPVPPVQAGDPVHYLVTVANNGAAVARNVTVVDEVPTGLTYTGFENVSPATWSRSAHATVPWDQFSLTSDSHTLPVGASRSIVVEYGTSASTPADVNNCVQAGSSDNSSQPRDCASFTSDRISDLSLKKDVITDLAGTTLPDGTVVIAGNVVTYRLDVKNEGPSDALGAISVTDTLPANFTYVEDSATVGGVASEPSAAGQALTWEILPASGTLPAANGSNTITIELQATVAATQAPAIGLTNTATVSGQNDPNPSNNTDVAKVNISTEANMSIVKVVELGPWYAGNTVTYTLTVENEGPSVASTARVVDTLPAGLTMVSMVGDDWNCVAAIGAQTGTCDYDGTHPVGSSTITVVATIASDLPISTQVNPFNNVATLNWTDSRIFPDPEDDPRHRSDDAAITVTTQADLGLVKTAVDPADNTTEVTSAVAGQQARYRIDVTNYGPSDAAPNLVVTDTLPIGVAYVAPVGTTSTNWKIVASNYDPAVAQTVTFTRVNGVDPSGLPIVGTSPASAPAIIFDVLLSSELASTDLPTVPAILNVATVVSGTPEPAVDPHPNTDDAALNVVRSADLEIVKSHPVADDRDRVFIGEQLDFTIDVTNHGPSISSGFTVTDTVPVGFEVTAVDGLTDFAALPGQTTGSNWRIDSVTPITDPDAADFGKTLVVATYLGELGVADGVDNAADPLIISTMPNDDAFSEADDVVNYVEITDANEPDPVDPNNEFEDPIKVRPVVTLVIEKTAVGEFKVGRTGLYSITVENLGPHTDHGPITVTDQLPAGLSFNGSPKLPEGATVTHDKGLVTWTLTEPLGVDENAELMLVVNVLQAAYDQPNHTVINEATVDTESGKSEDPRWQPTDDASVKVKPVDPLVVTGGELAGGMLAALTLLLLLGGGTYLAGRKRGRARHG